MYKAFQWYVDIRLQHTLLRVTGGQRIYMFHTTCRWKVLASLLHQSPCFNPHESHIHFLGSCFVVFLSILPPVRRTSFGNVFLFDDMTVRTPLTTSLHVGDSSLQHAFIFTLCARQQDFQGLILIRSNLTGNEPAEESD